MAACGHSEPQPGRTPETRGEREREREAPWHSGEYTWQQQLQLLHIYINLHLFFFATFFSKSFQSILVLVHHNIAPCTRRCSGGLQHTTRGNSSSRALKSDSKSHTSEGFRRTGSVKPPNSKVSWVWKLMNFLKYPFYYGLHTRVIWTNNNQGDLGDHITTQSSKSE